MFTWPLNALLYAVLDTPIRARTAYRLSRCVAKHLGVAMHLRLANAVAVGSGHECSPRAPVYARACSLALHSPSLYGRANTQPEINRQTHRLLFRESFSHVPRKIFTKSRPWPAVIRAR